MQVTKGTCACANSVYQALFPPPPHESLETRLYVILITKFIQWQLYHHIHTLYYFLPRYNLRNILVVYSNWHSIR